MKYYVLDTSILVYFFRKDDNFRKINRHFEFYKQDVQPVISAVSKGELISLSIQLDWGKNKFDSLMKLFIEMSKIDVSYFNEELQDAYSEIDSYSYRKLTDKFGNLLPNGTITMGKNDLWIAATTKVLNADLITADKDFDHLNNTFFTVHYFDKSFFTNN